MTDSLAKTSAGHHTYCMSDNILSPTNDWIFKLLFGDERNKSTLIDLLKSFVQLPEEEYELVYLDTHLKREYDDDKFGILDVKVKTKTGQIVHIEIQVEPMPDMAKRLSFYKSKLITSQINKGDSYEKIQPVICVCITSKPMFPEVMEYLNRFFFYNPANGLRFRNIPEEIYTLELSKLPQSSDGSTLWEWMKFLTSKTKEEFEMIAKGNPEIRKATDILYELSQDEKVRAEYEAREKAWRDRISAIDAGVRRGREEGWQGGRKEREVEVARNAIAKGFTLEQVCDITGLDTETLAKL